MSKFIANGAINFGIKTNLSIHLMNWALLSQVAHMLYITEHNCSFVCTFG